jgi:glutamate-1-semialdehyde 2,1-aminomutase
MYCGLDRVWNERARLLNERFAAEGLPLEIANMSSIWTACYRRPSRYNWMLQYYLRAEGLALSWIGTGRLIFSLDYTEDDFAAVADRFVAAARAMQADGWWWYDPQLTNRAIKRQLLKEMIVHRLLPPRRR